LVIFNYQALTLAVRILTFTSGVNPDKPLTNNGFISPSGKIFNSIDDFGLNSILSKIFFNTSELY